jgi:hypothetical protein
MTAILVFSNAKDMWLAYRSLTGLKLYRIETNLPLSDRDVRWQLRDKRALIFIGIGGEIPSIIKHNIMGAKVMVVNRTVTQSFVKLQTPPAKPTLFLVQTAAKAA